MRVALSFCSPADSPPQHSSCSSLTSNQLRGGSWRMVSLAATSDPGVVGAVDPLAKCTPWVCCFGVWKQEKNYWVESIFFEVFTLVRGLHSHHISKIILKGF